MVESQHILLPPLAGQTLAGYVNYCSFQLIAKIDWAWLITFIQQRISTNVDMDDHLERRNIFSKIKGAFQAC